MRLDRPTLVPEPIPINVTLQDTWKVRSMSILIRTLPSNQKILPMAAVTLYHHLKTLPNC